MYLNLVRSWKCLSSNSRATPLPSSYPVGVFICRPYFVLMSAELHNSLYYSTTRYSSTLFLTCSILVTLICEKKRIFTCN